jgi:hypothetical protein
LIVVAPFDLAADIAIFGVMIAVFSYYSLRFRLRKRTDN